MKLLVIGAGNGGAATAVELSRAGHDVTLHARSEATLSPFRNGGIRYVGVLGEGCVPIALLTTDLGEAVRDVDAAIVALPTFAHAGVARALHAAGWGDRRPVILNPGHTGGAFEVETVFRDAGGPVPPIVEFSTLAYVARKLAPDTVNITGRAKSLRAASLPGGSEALAMACSLFPGIYDTRSVLASDLSNVNMILHPPGAMLSAAWVEATGGDFRFYVDGMTPGTIEVMRELDDERRSVAQSFGHALPSVIGEMRAIGTVPADAADTDYTAIAAGEANSRIMAPDSLAHRYYTEDFAHGLVPFLALAGIAGVDVPVASALVVLHTSMTRNLAAPALRDARAMGIENLSLDELRRRAGAC